MANPNSASFAFSPLRAVKNSAGNKRLRKNKHEAPPHKGDPEQVENVPGREQLNPHRRPDPDETYRTGRQGPGRT